MNKNVEKFLIEENVFAEKLPLHSSVWIYGANRLFTSEESNKIKELAKEFASQWTSHKVQMYADGALLHNCFLVLAADEKMVATGGCTIDSSTNWIKKLGKEFDADFMNRQLLYLLQDGEIRILTLAEAADAYADGNISDSSLVFNNLVKTKEDLVKKWLIPLSESPLFKLVNSPVQEFLFKL
ncbi:MAG: hypothetical protein M9931_04440 [Chitinophagales bacterium]|nr:hypothetical protein [Chitinophagales bacterium]